MLTNADSGEIWVRNKYPNAYDIVFDAKNKTVMVYERDKMVTLSLHLKGLLW